MHTLLNATLLVGCDGINSVVRHALKIDTIQLPSASAGLRYKMVTLKNRFKLPSQVHLEPSIPERAYIFRSKRKDNMNRMSLGLLPVRGDAPRTANIICDPRHQIWCKKDEASVREYLTEQFPQIDINDFFSEDEV